MDSLNAIIILEHIQLVETTAARTHQYRKKSLVTRLSVV